MGYFESGSWNSDGSNWKELSSFMLVPTLLRIVPSSLESSELRIFSSVVENRANLPVCPFLCANRC